MSTDVTPIGPLAEPPESGFKMEETSEGLPEVGDRTILFLTVDALDKGPKIGVALTDKWWNMSTPEMDELVWSSIELAIKAMRKARSR